MTFLIHGDNLFRVIVIMVYNYFYRQMDACNSITLILFYLFRISFAPSLFDLRLHYIYSDASGYIRGL